VICMISRSAPDAAYTFFHDLGRGLSEIADVSYFYDCPSN